MERRDGHGCHADVEIHAQLLPKTSPEVAQSSESADFIKTNDFLSEYSGGTTIR